MASLSTGSPGLVVTVTAADSPYTVDPQIVPTVNADATAGAVTVNLCPAAAFVGSPLRVKAISSTSNLVTLQAAGSDLIDGASSVTLGTSGKYPGVTLVSDGTAWRVNALHGTPASVANAMSLPSPMTGSSGGFYLPDRSLYVPGALRSGGLFQKTRAKLGAAKAGTGLINICCIGTSLTEGYFGGGAGNTPDKASYPVQLRQLLNSLGYTQAGTGWVIMQNNNSNNFDSRWSLGAGWTRAGSTTLMYGIGPTSATAATFTSDLSGTVAEILYLDGASNNPINVSIDAGGNVATTAANTQTVRKYSVGSLTNGTHTIACAAANAQLIYVVAAQVRQTSGVLVHNCGMGSSQSSDWINSGYFRSGQVVSAAMSPDLTIIDMPINDALNQVATATTLANLKTLVGNYQAVGSEILLVCDPSPETTQFSSFNPVSTAQWQSYQQVMYQLADAMGVPLLDLTDAYGLRTGIVTNGLDYDGVHLSAAGYAAWASSVVRALL